MLLLPAAGFEQISPPTRLVKQSAKALQEPMQTQLGGALQNWVQEMKTAQTSPAFGKLPVLLEALHNPWKGFASLETSAREILTASATIDGGTVEFLIKQTLPLLDVPASQATPEKHTEPTFANRYPLFEEADKEPVSYLLGVIEAAHEARERALRALSAEERDFLSSWPCDSVRLFYVHFYSAQPAFLEQYGLTGQERVVFRGAQKWAAENDLRFLQLLCSKVDFSALGKAASILGRLADPDWQQALQTELADAQPIQEPVPGIEGDVLRVEETAAGKVIITGKGNNQYSLRVSPAAIIDLGGDNQWVGALASSTGAASSNAVIVALGDGKNEFHGGDFGLATGTLGVGLLLSGSGDDFYHGRDACGGVGLGGIGLLIDRGGANRYRGGRFALGAAMGGMGLLLSAGENESFQGQLYALGFGGPGGVGAVVRTGGSASYVAGYSEPSGYNDLRILPGDRGYQWETYSLGCGSGKRIFSPVPEEAALSLAGGVGMLLEATGDSTYESSNFALGCGYFFGAGVVLDRAGDDRYLAARYGMASGAHYGVGLFLEESGNDRYSTRGPTYNCGAAWDRTVAVFVEGAGDDTFDLTGSAGLGISQHSSLAVASDLAGEDTYIVSSGLGTSGEGSPAIFSDSHSPNTFEKWPPQADFQPGNGIQIPRPPAGWFLSK